MSLKLKTFKQLLFFQFSKKCCFESMKAELFFIREEKLNVEKVFTRRDATNFQSVKVIFKLKLL